MRKFDDEVTRLTSNVHDKTAKAEELGKELDDARAALQLRISLGQAPTASGTEFEALRSKDDELKTKPENEYTAKDYIDRAYAAYAESKPGLAADYFRQASTTSGATNEDKALSLFNYAYFLGDLGRREDEVAAYDQFLTLFGDATQLVIRRLVAMALLNKGIALGEANRSIEEIPVYDDIVRRFADSADAELRNVVADALLSKGITLGELKRTKQEMATYDEVTNRFGEATEFTLQEPVAKALLYKSITLDDLNRSEEEIAILNDLVKRFGDSAEPTLQDLVATGLMFKGAALNR